MSDDSGKRYYDVSPIHWREARALDELAKGLDEFLTARLTPKHLPLVAAVRKVLAYADDVKILDAVLGGFDPEARARIQDAVRDVASRRLMNALGAQERRAIAPHISSIGAWRASGHGRVVCAECGTVVSQCRCPDGAILRGYSMCERCRARREREVGECTVREPEPSPAPSAPSAR